ncbi:hypothetical protein AAFC00_006134 [Neodothiora populina]|uniref:Myb-like domain-containing protein n=1 Tax=Neodothiora populina TaxID=2781224 RepID=A0ABR3P458_9PEZI
MPTQHLSPHQYLNQQNLSPQFGISQMPVVFAPAVTPSRKRSRMEDDFADYPAYRVVAGHPDNIGYQTSSDISNRTLHPQPVPAASMLPGHRSPSQSRSPRSQRSRLSPQQHPHLPSRESHSRTTHDVQQHHHHHRLPSQQQSRDGNVSSPTNREIGPPSMVGQEGMPSPAPRPKGPKLKFTREEDALLVELKETKDLTWKQIADFFPGRSSGTLQVRYCTKLKAKTTAWSDEMIQRLQTAIHDYNNDRWRIISSKVGNGFSATACQAKADELNLDPNDDGRGNLHQRDAPDPLGATGEGYDFDEEEDRPYEDFETGQHHQHHHLAVDHGDKQQQQQQQQQQRQHQPQHQQQRIDNTSGAKFEDSSGQ